MTSAFVMVTVSVLRPGESSGFPLRFEKFGAARFQHVAFNEKVVRDSWNAQCSRVKRSGVGGGFAPNDFDAELSSQFRQAENDATPNAAHARYRRGNDRWMNGKKLENEVVAVG